MIQTTAMMDGNHWVVKGRKAFIMGARGAKVGIVLVKSYEGAYLFLVDLPYPAIRIDRVLDTIDHLHVSADDLPGHSGKEFKYAQICLALARLSRCMGWLGACVRANEITSDYGSSRMAVGKSLIDHEGIGSMLAEKLIDLKQAELMIDRCATVFDTGALGVTKSSMAKVAVSAAPMRIADCCAQVMSGTAVSGNTVVEEVFRDIRAFRNHDGPTDAHKCNFAGIKRGLRAEWVHGADG